MVIEIFYLSRNEFLVIPVPPQSRPKATKTEFIDSFQEFGRIVNNRKIPIVLFANGQMRIEESALTLSNKAKAVALTTIAVSAITASKPAAVNKEQIRSISGFERLINVFKAAVIEPLNSTATELKAREEISLYRKWLKNRLTGGSKHLLADS